MEKTSDRRLLLLDTHIWIWLMAGAGELNAESRRIINSALEMGMLRIAAISLWETALLASRGRILLGKSTGSWVQEALAGPGPAIEPLTAAIAIESYALPDRFHQDPADRMIVATARVTGAVLMTRDQGILCYAERGHLTALQA
ncbi:MAG: type II toxin-antitoxin system VapC family toxin [Stellaceae bacterium]